MLIIFLNFLENDVGLFLFAHDNTKYCQTKGLLLSTERPFPTPPKIIAP